ncbi:DegQ family serine endoprotease [Thalassobaculum sp.]|uniref:DegQ family serine endoprotease n=1 Tax=Thalassobaculum sp. TaxID=2022740 RepID=UPI003B5CB971
MGLKTSATAVRIMAVDRRAEAAASLYRLAIAGALAAMLAFGMALSNTAHAKAPPESFADLAERLLPAVVNIATTQTVDSSRMPDMPQFPPGSPFEEFFKDFFERNQGQRPQRPRSAQSLGSGFIIDPSGIVVTNNHVIADADEIKVRLQDDTEYEATLIGKDPKTDVAVLSIDPGQRELPFVEFGNSGSLRVGDWVVAIGNPFGLGGTVTAGIVSARGRDIGQGPYDDFLQTDASINRGNSGGPLFNLEGQVVGINTAIFSQTGGSVGIGFAIASDLASGVVDQLREFGRTRRGWLGVRIQQVSPDIADSLGLDTARGALVADVTPDGPAEAAGIQPGDVITGFNGQPVDEMRTLPRIVAETRVGREVPVEVWRDGASMTVTATLGELEQAEEARMLNTSATPGPTDEGRVDSLGLGLATLTPQLREQYGITEEVEGVVVTEVDDTVDAADKGLREGDVIVEVAQDEVRSLEDVRRLVEDHRTNGKKTILLLVNRQGEQRFIPLRIDKG